jgi:hypothetical protein
LYALLTTLHGTSCLTSKPIKRLWSLSPWLTEHDLRFSLHLSRTWGNIDEYGENEDDFVRCNLANVYHSDFQLEQPCHSKSQISGVFKINSAVQNCMQS